jgi:23S rRNA pseudouridine2605 synthase
MSETAAAAASAPEGERVAKLIARAGLCSRRDAERLVAERRVAVDGRVLDSPAFNVRPGQRVTVDGKPLPAAKPVRLFRYHKPAGLLVAARDPEGRRTIYDALPEDLPRLMPIGRLDLSSEGLLLLTNDGGLKRRLELPATGWLRRYRVRIWGHPDEPALRSLAGGITVDGVAYGPIEAKLDRLQGDNAWLTVALREGKNREVRKALEHLGFSVNRLIRLAYGPFQLGHLEPRAIEEVRPKVLKEQLGAFLPAGPSRAAARRAAR